MAMRGVSARSAGPFGVLQSHPTIRPSNPARDPVARARRQGAGTLQDTARTCDPRRADRTGEQPCRRRRARRDSNALPFGVVSGRPSDDSGDLHNGSSVTTTMPANSVAVQSAASTSSSIARARPRRNSGRYVGANRLFAASSPFTGTTAKMSPLLFNCRNPDLIRRPLLDRTCP